MTVCVGIGLALVSCRWAVVQGVTYAIGIGVKRNTWIQGEYISAVGSTVVIIVGIGIVTYAVAIRINRFITI